jgi:dTDP-4-dehydrorhamnose reductase
MKSAAGLSTRTLPALAVFGASGFIGRNLFRTALTGNGRSLAFARRPTDDQRPFTLERPDIRPFDLRARGITHAVIAGGVTDPRRCESDPGGTRAVNVDGPLELARQLGEEGIAVAAYSSDYVFDGRFGRYDEDSPVNPLNEYGRQKADLERSLLEGRNPRPLVLRLSKVYDIEKGSGTLLDEMAGLLRGGRPLRAAVDQVFCPTFVDDVVDVTISLARSGATGLVNLCAPGKTSRYDLACRAAALLGAPPGLVNKILLADLDEPFTRPLNTSMITPRLEACLDHTFATLDESLSLLGKEHGA